MFPVELALLCVSSDLRNRIRNNTHAEASLPGNASRIVYRWGSGEYSLQFPQEGYEPLRVITDREGVFVAVAELAVLRFVFKVCAVL